MAGKKINVTFSFEHDGPLIHIHACALPEDDGWGRVMRLSTYVHRSTSAEDIFAEMKSLRALVLDAFIMNEARKEKPRG